MADDATDDDVQPQSRTTAGETKSRAPALEHVDLVAYEISLLSKIAETARMVP